MMGGVVLEVFLIGNVGLSGAGAWCHAQRNGGGT